MNNWTNEDATRLTELETVFEAAGGRGVELADEIDALRARRDGDTEYAPAVDTTVRVTPRIRELARALLADPLTEQPPYTRELAELVGVLLARPITDQTVNAGYVVRHVIDGAPAEPGLLRSWWVACESTDEPGTWVTWEACALDGSQAGRLGYNAGHYFQSPTRACRDGLNRQRALADLAVRAGAMSQVAVMIADEVTRYHAITGPYTTGEREDRRMASRLRKWAE